MKHLLQLTVILIALTANAMAQTTYYVNAGGTGAGTSWNDASDLQSALDKATSGDEIWVAQGTYTPSKIAGDTPGIDPRDRAFVIPSNVKVYGGFAGTEEVFFDRKIADNKTTILNGDMGNAGTADNVYHVVIAAAKENESITLDGFTITGGNANGSGTITVNGSSLNRSGGGGVSASGSITITNNTIKENQASGGGGVSASGSITITNNTIKENQAFGGGGVSASGSIIITNNTIKGNHSSDGGGVSASGFITITNNTIAENTTYGYGGGVCAYDSSYGSITITNNTIKENQAHEGGGVFVRGYGYGSITITNNTIVKNTAFYGGGVHTDGFSSITITNNTIAKNTAARNGGGVVAEFYDSFAINNTIFVNNAPNDIVKNGVGSVSIAVNYSLLQKALDSGIGGGNNIVGQDPQFVNAANGDYSLKATSPAINTGNKTLFNTSMYGDKDIAGNARIQKGEIDMGAYESTYGNTPTEPEVIIPSLVDMEALYNFLTQPSAEEGKSNWQQLYPVTAPPASAEEWLNGTDFSAGGTLVWFKTDGEFRLVTISWKGRKLAGTLDLSACKELKKLNVAKNSIRGINVDGCSWLGQFNADNQQITLAETPLVGNTLVVSNPLTYVGTSASMTSAIVFSGFTPEGSSGADQLQWLVSENNGIAICQFMAPNLGSTGTGFSGVLLQPYSAGSVSNEVLNVSSARVWSSDGSIKIETAAPSQITVVSISGTTVYSSTHDSGLLSIPQAKGLYIVRIGDEIVKVVNR